MSKIQNKVVVAATASKTVVTLYFDDGTDLSLPPNEQFTLDVVEKITPALVRGEKILLNMQSRKINIFTEMEKKSGGMVKFFRVAKKSLGLGGDNPTETHIESIALPMEDYDFKNHDETVVAIVHEESNTVSAEPAGKVIVGAEALRNQIKHFSEQENPVGFNAFMARLSKVVDQRRHTVSELLAFLDKADLPIADDGSIVAYKRLKSADGDYMVDSHSGKVKQKVGSRVFMKPEMVDPNRNNQCSNGLHIGRRDYMGSFSGDAIIICKIAPEDVIAVPNDYNGAKMRCSGYHIVHRLNAEAMKAVINGNKMTSDEETALTLTRILRGDHIGVIETTEITKSYGGGLIITPIAKKKVGKNTPLSKKTVDKINKPVEPTQALEQVETTVPQVNPELNSPKAIKDKVKKATKPLKAPVIAQEGDMTEYQLEAKRRWHEIAEGKISKVKLAQACKTSTRSLDRWAKKFNF